MQITKRPNCRSLGSNRNSMKIRFIHKIQYSRQCYMTLVVLHFLMLESQPVNIASKTNTYFLVLLTPHFIVFEKNPDRRLSNFLDIF